VQPKLNQGNMKQIPFVLPGKAICDAFRVYPGIDFDVNGENSDTCGFFSISNRNGVRDVEIRNPSSLFHGRNR